MKYIVLHRLRNLERIINEIRMKDDVSGSTETGSLPAIPEQTEEPFEKFMNVVKEQKVSKLPYFFELLIKLFRASISTESRSFLI